WKEVKKDENTYAAPAVKALKKAFSILKKKKEEQDVSWLLRVYDVAVRKFPGDEWIKREKASLHLRNNELEQAKRMYKELLPDLSDKYYVWQEFAACMPEDKLGQIGILAKAISVEKNEDFLGEVRLDFAEILITEEYPEHAFVELETYRKHRETKGRHSDRYELLKTKAKTTTRTDNREFFAEFIEYAEELAFSDIPWTEVVLT